MLFSLFILLFLFSFFVLYEQKVKKWNFYSPVVLLGGPLISLILLSCILSPMMGFITINSKALNLFIYGLGSFWLGGMFITPIGEKIMKKGSNTAFQLKSKTRLFFHLTCAFFVAIMLLNLHSLLSNRSLMMLEDQEFAQRGFEAHIGGLIMAYLMFYIISFWEKISVNRILAFFFVCIIFILKMLSGIRGNIILPLVGACIYLVSRKLVKVSLKNLLVLCTAVFALFMLPTLFFSNDESTTNYIVSYFVFYFSAGILGLSSYMEQHYVPWEINPNFIYTFYINLWEKLFGNNDYVSAINPEFVTVTLPNSEFRFTSNVYTLIGEVYVNCGYMVGSLFFFFLGAYAYGLYFFSNRSIMLLLLYAFVGGCLFLGIFSQYVLMPYFYEIQLLFLLLHFVSKSTVSKSFFQK